MIYRGETTMTLWKEKIVGEDVIDTPQEVGIDWTAEQTELGDGRKEWDFQYTASTEDGEEVELTEQEEERLFESLRANGEF